MDTANTNNVKNKLMKPTNGGKKQPATLKEWILASAGEIRKALPKMMDEERFIRIATTAVSTNSALQECESKSFCIALLQSAQLGLEPNTPLGQAYLIPYKKVCQFQLGYKGILTLAYRTGEFEFIDAQVVYQNDEFEFEYGLDRKLKHKPAKGNRGEVEWYYAVYKLKSGGSGFVVMSYEDILEHAKKYSKSYNSSSSPWQTAFDEMAKKTCIKKALKYAPTSVEFQKAIVQDGSVKREISSNMLDVPGEFIEVDYTASDIQEAPAIETSIAAENDPAELFDRATS